MDLLSQIAVLLVEDEEADVLAFKTTLAEVGEVTFKIAVAHTIGAAEEELRAGQFDVVMLDLFLPDATFLDGLERLIRQYPDTPIVVYTGMYSREMAARCIRLGAQDYIIKQYTDPDDLSRRIVHAVERHRWQRRAVAIAEAGGE